MTESGGRLLRDLPAAVCRQVRADELGAVVSRALAPVVAHDALRLAGTAPSMAGGTVPLGFLHGYDDDFAQASAYLCVGGQDPLRWEVLARRPVPVGRIEAGSGSGGDRAIRALYAEHGVGSELRLLLRDGRGVWGALSLLRARGGRAFDAGDALRVAESAPVLIAALRGYVTSGPLAPVGPAQPPGVVIIGPDDEVRAATSDAARWQPRDTGHRREWVAKVFFAALATQARRHARNPGESAAVVLGPAATFGRWVCFHAQPIDRGEPGEVAAVIQAASGPQLLPVFADWYGLTARERQVVAELLDGAVPKQIARRLDVSVHTVNDHFKSIFRKTAADGRHHLVTALAG